MNIARLFRRALLTLCLLTASGAALAQNATQCGLTGSAVAAQTIYYDPFSPSGLSQVDVPLTLTRATGSGGKKTQQVYFILTQPTGSPAYQVLALAPGGGSYNNVLYTTGSTNGLPIKSSNQAGQIYYNFGGASQPDTVTFTIRVTVPAGVDLSAGQPVRFDVVYVCDGTGGLSDVNSAVTNPQSVSINVNVLSALQASYVGSALSFGEVGDKTTTQVLAAPATYTTPTSNYIRVASSGPYKVDLAPTTGQTYRLTYPGGSAAVAAQSLKYKVKFLGQTRDNTSPTFTTVTCVRAGTSATNGALPITATLLEGGQGKAVSSQYSETLVVTVTPLVSSAGSQQNCPSL